MMGKRMPSFSFITFATGFAFALYGLFVIACDVFGLRVGIFTTFGTNALAAYFLHHVVEEAVSPLVPHDAPLWYCLAGLATLLCRHLRARAVPREAENLFAALTGFCRYKRYVRNLRPFVVGFA